MEKELLKELVKVMCIFNERIKLLEQLMYGGWDRPENLMVLRAFIEDGTQSKTTEILDELIKEHGLND